MWSQSVSTRNASEKVRRPAAQAPRPSAHVARVSLRTTLPSNRVPSAANSRARAPQVPTPKLRVEENMGKKKRGQRFYAVHGGPTPGVYRTWEQALAYASLSHTLLSRFALTLLSHTSHASPDVTLPMLPHMSHFPFFLYLSGGSVCTRCNLKACNVKCPTQTIDPPHHLPT